jgi:hypothetical protein
MDIGRTMLLNSKARHRLDAGTFGTNYILNKKKIISLTTSFL